MAARNLGYASLDDLREKAEAERAANALKEEGKALAKKQKAEKLQAEAEQEAAAAREHEAQRRDLHIVIERIETRLKELREWDPESAEKRLLASIASLRARPATEIMFNPQVEYQVNEQLMELVRTRLLKDINAESIKILEAELAAASAELQSVEAL